MVNLYKFMGADIADKLMMDDAHIGIKFSHLKDYNDPYEFFLIINYDRTPDELAFYSEMIDMVLKQPATCFARSPVITPMWAHYAGNSSGFAIEIDEDRLREHLETLDLGRYSAIEMYDTRTNRMISVTCWNGPVI